MLVDGKIWVGSGDEPSYLLLDKANRHGLVCGATGTGKTTTLKVLAEGFSAAGVPCFLSDVKGDVSGMGIAGTDSPKIQERVKKFAIENWAFRASPVRFWDVFGEQGIPLRVTVSQMGPELLARVLDLTDVQEGCLDVVFRIADDRKMLLIDLKDLRAMLSYVADHSDEFETSYGKVASSSVGAILRSLIRIEDEGGDKMFGEPAIELSDWIACAPDGSGYLNVLSAVKLIQSPTLYAMLLLWMLSDLYDTLPEVGDSDKPKLVFFFDEAHLLFHDMPNALVDKIIQIIKLVRSKGVGIYFITQSPGDIPEEVLAQLSNRIEHALRAYTPAEQKVVKAAADAFRPNPAFKTVDVITELATGEALMSFLDDSGAPCVVQKALVLPPQCSFTPMDADTFAQTISGDAAMIAKYGTTVDPVSAYETINASATAQPADAGSAAAPADQAPAEPAQSAPAEAAPEQTAREKKESATEARKAQIAEEKAEKEEARRRAEVGKAVGKVATSTLTQVGRTVGNTLVRGLLKSLKL